MQHVLRCDYEACRQYLVNLEQAFLLDQGNQALGALLGHRCDGNRNILHAAVSVCFPVSNKETKEEEGKLLSQSILYFLWVLCFSRKSFSIFFPWIHLHFSSQCVSVVDFSIFIMKLNCERKLLFLNLLFPLQVCSPVTV